MTRASIVSALCITLLPACAAAHHQAAPTSSSAPSSTTATVLSITDGDTIKVKLSGKTETLRLVGIDTPETKDPRKPVQCFGKEATAKMKALVAKKTVTLETGGDDRDKYKRLLRYVMLGGEDIGATMIEEGYAFSYKTFSHPRLEDYNALEEAARDAKRGLWGDICGGKATAVSSTGKETSRAAKSATSAKSASKSSASRRACDIKGNISATDEKIFHVPGCGSYAKTVIDEDAGERLFCSEKEAIAAGWRKAKNC